jgi:regulator of nonsense transcripts 2
MPSDSAFAVAMRSQQQAERAEQQRIKNLVLNYDLTNDQEDGDLPSFHYVQAPDNRVRLVGTGSLNRRGLNLKLQGRFQHKTQNDSDEENKPPPEETHQPLQQHSLTDETGSFETLHNGPRYDKSGNTRSKQRARKLQLGDIDWYGRTAPASASAERLEGQHSLDEYVVDKQQSSRRRRLEADLRSRHDSAPQAQASKG